MHESLEISAPAEGQAATSNTEEDGSRILCRSPHPYHRHKAELLEPAWIAYGAGGVEGAIHDSASHHPPSESGTEADDEHYLKGLPAPKARLHKGLRGIECLSGSSTPLLSPTWNDDWRPTETRKDSPARGKRTLTENARRQKELSRRALELLLLAGQGVILWLNEDVRKSVKTYSRDLVGLGLVLTVLVLLYPARLILWAHTHRRPADLVALSVPTSFDPAPLLYAPFIPVFVSLLTAAKVEGAILPNLILSICTLPRALIPMAGYWESYNTVHWLLSCVPVFTHVQERGRILPGGLSADILVLIYPLHQILCGILHYLTTSSLLTAELQLLSVGLINVLLLASSPQTIILKALLWLGGLSLLITCGRVVRWGISLARVPKWRFRRAPIYARGGSLFRRLRGLWRLGRKRRDARPDFEESAFETELSEGFADSRRSSLQSIVLTRARRADTINVETRPAGRVATLDDWHDRLATTRQAAPRRNTLPTLDTGKLQEAKTHTPSGRRKRSASSSVRAWFSLTQEQATFRKWLYAAHVYTSMLVVVLAGSRWYVQKFALTNREPVGWALAYLFGDIPAFRFQVVAANLENWIRLPARLDPEHTVSCSMGWLQHLRHTSVGEANTRLIICAWCIAIIITGLAVVFQLSPVYEVDTRRKVFHFMMVAMFLPTIFVDPTFISLAFSLILAIFLLVDLLRASQLPPLSKPIAAFLTPYVDGRDLRGPVVISHIFLLIGCAIPLWLSLATLPRLGDGWEVPTRDVSMVAGIICVGLGDAAASLIGRRWGRRKWMWGGGKSLEGSIAFATAVMAGLLGASAWLRLGGWPATTTAELGTWMIAWGTVRKAAWCAGTASLTEAVLTGGNDNVVVPVVLWTCVKGMGI